MAKPIKVTPIVKGQDAKRFIRAMNRVDSAPVEPGRLARIRAAGAQAKIIAPSSNPAPTAKKSLRK